ncbi:hypothetical protein [Alienimonas sp. DA493]|uniref:hypothetical protein n=1 Tax=Alienimonas sp. DA493 TaxID=3373605 RepID=UPI0037552B94
MPTAVGLLAEAGAAGLLVWRDGDRLRVRGPVAASHLARRLLADKAGVLSALDAREALVPLRSPRRLDQRVRPARHLCDLPPAGTGGDRCAAGML